MESMDKSKQAEERNIDIWEWISNIEDNEVKFSMINYIDDM